MREASARGFICDDPAVLPLLWPCGAVEDAEVVDATFRVLLRTPALGPATSPCAERDEDAVLLPPSISVLMILHAASMKEFTFRLSRNRLVYNCCPFLAFFLSSFFLFARGVCLAVRS